MAHITIDSGYLLLQRGYIRYTLFTHRMVRASIITTAAEGSVLATLQETLSTVRSPNLKSTLLYQKLTHWK